MCFDRRVCCCFYCKTKVKELIFALVVFTLSIVLCGLSIGFGTHVLTRISEKTDFQYQHFNFRSHLYGKYIQHLNLDRLGMYLYRQQVHYCENATCIRPNRIQVIKDCNLVHRFFLFNLGTTHLILDYQCLFYNIDFMQTRYLYSTYHLEKKFTQII